MWILSADGLAKLLGSSTHTSHAYLLNAKSRGGCPFLLLCFLCFFSPPPPLPLSLPSVP